MTRLHSNALIKASDRRAVDEQSAQTLLQRVQYSYNIWNSEIEPLEHDSDYPCNCGSCQLKRLKWNRSQMQDEWIAATLYPGENAYNPNNRFAITFLSSPYASKIWVTPYTGSWSGYPNANSHATWITQTIALNNKLNAQAQANIDAKEPKVSIWDDHDLAPGANRASVDKKAFVDSKGDSHRGNDRKMDLETSGVPDKKIDTYKNEDSPPGYAPPQAGPSKSATDALDPPAKPELKKRTSVFSKIGLALQRKPSESRQASNYSKAVEKARPLRESILQEEQGRWPDEEWRSIVRIYQEKTGMTRKIAELRARQPIQYLHLLRAGYFEPIPVAWATQNSNPLKFSIEGAAGWRGITPQWRGYEDTAEERLYWVLNHREGTVGTRLKPDFISALETARERMSKAVAPPPEYFDSNDTCHVQHITDGYSKQVMPAPFKAFDRPETTNDDTMILLDVSGSMGFIPQSPVYEKYLITKQRTSAQPKNKDVAKAIIRRFTDAMQNHDCKSSGYDLTTFSTNAKYVGEVTHWNLDSLWDNIQIGGGTRVMTGWQMVKERHFQKHSASAIHHPVYGWQAGPETPMLRLLLLLDGEATDMDEFELDLLGLGWAHVTIFLIGVDGCPHHHRHANELQRISDVNHHVSFVDAQGNTPERFVTHELLKRHLGYDVTMQEFEDMEVPPSYGDSQAMQ